MEEWFKTFSANCCNWISIRYHAVRRVELIGYSVRFGHPILFRVFHCQNKSVGLYNGIISHTVQLWFSLQMLFRFVWILLLSSISLQSWGRFYEPPGRPPIYRLFGNTDNETVVPEIAFKGHSRSSALSSFARWPGISTRDRKCRLHLFLDKNS